VKWIDYINNLYKKYLLEIIIFLFSFYHHDDDISLHYATVQEGIKWILNGKMLNLYVYIYIYIYN
jgi:hypothetical protein